MPFGKFLPRTKPIYGPRHRRFCNPNGIVSSSPRLRGTSYLGLRDGRFSTPTGLRPAASDAPQPRWGCDPPPLFPRVARSSQPWALGRNPFGIQRKRPEGAKQNAAASFVPPFQGLKPNATPHPGRCPGLSCCGLSARRFAARAFGSENSFAENGKMIQPVFGANKTICKAETPSDAQTSSRQNKPGCEKFVVV